MMHLGGDNYSHEGHLVIYIIYVICIKTTTTTTTKSNSHLNGTADPGDSDQVLGGRLL
jgi:hypothetical protein